MQKVTGQVFSNKDENESSNSHKKTLFNLALIDSDKWDKTAHAKSYIVDTSPKCAEYIFEKD